MRIALNRPREQAERLHYPIVLVRGPKWYSAEIEVIGGRVARWSVSDAPDLGGLQRGFDHPGDADGDLVLQLEHVFQRAVEPVGPQMRSIRRVDQLRGNAHPTASIAYRAFEHRPCDILEGLLGQAFETGGDVDAVAEYVVVLDDDVADVDADAEVDAAFCRYWGIAFGHCPLQLGRASERVDDAGELDQEAVAGGLDDAAVMAGDFWVDQLGAERLEPAERPFLIGFDQPRVAGDVSREDRRKPTFDAIPRFGLHGASSVADDLTRHQSECPADFIGIRTPILVSRLKGAETGAAPCAFRVKTLAWTPMLMFWFEH